MAPLLLAFCLTTPPAAPVPSPGTPTVESRTAGDAVRHACDCVAAVRLLWQLPLVAWANASQRRCNSERPVGRAVEAPKTRPVALVATKWFNLWVDDEPRPRLQNAMGMKVIVLTHGRHRLRFDNPHACPLTMILDVDEHSPAGRLPVKLRAREPADAPPGGLPCPRQP